MYVLHDAGQANSFVARELNETMDETRANISIDAG
jgi:hypothetical protein